MEQSREELIVDNMNLVYAALHKYYPTFAYDEDMVQCGMIGLIRSADTYDPEKSKFSTYATTAILNEFKMELRRRQTRIPEVSLSQSVGGGDDEELTLEGTMCGDEDVVYCDTEAMIAKLTDEEREALRLTTYGLTQREVAKKMKCSQPNVARILKKIKLKWSDVN